MGVEGESSMSVKVGHASLAENGKVSGGKAGDQTGKEVCFREWYKKPWSVMLRPKSTEIAEKSALACEKGVNNPNIGYGQNQRNTAHTQAQKVGYDLSKINTPCETDCSAFMTLCALAAGVKSLEYTGNSPTTSTMRKAFGRTGMYEVHTESKYLNTDEYLKRGDILVAEGKHTVMVLEDGSKAGVKKPLQEVAKEVIDGKWGKGQERRSRLTEAGYDYVLVQNEVNRMMLK